MSLIRNETILVKPVEENVATWIEDGKDGRVRWEGTETTYDAPLTSSGVMRVLTEKEQAELEKAIDEKRGTGWMSPYARVDNVWRGANRYKVVIPAEGMELNLNHPIDCIKYKLLLAQVDDVAPSYAEREMKRYLFYLESKLNIDATKTAKIDKLMKAQEHFARISDNKEKMRNLLLVLFKGDTTKVPKDMLETSMKTKLFEYIQDKTDMYLNEIENQEELKYRILYYKAVETGAFERRGFEIRVSHMNGKLLGTTIEEAVKYIKAIESDTSRQDEYAKFLERIKK
jgi:hypothetical protein